MISWHNEDMKKNYAGPKYAGSKEFKHAERLRSLPDISTYLIAFIFSPIVIPGLVLLLGAILLLGPVAWIIEICHDKMWGIYLKTVSKPEYRGVHGG